MKISEKLTQQKFKELLEDLYTKGQESELHTSDMIHEIQHKLNGLIENKKQMQP